MCLRVLKIGRVLNIEVQKMGKRLLDSKEHETSESLAREESGVDLKHARSCLLTVGWAEGVRLLRLSNLVGA